ncbi:MAG TPA: outer membrane beta-barrel protein, partial [Cyclobacteriaceae bacterium]|nr:outer membrane beta-barrel protein [Cyclobacteriaceae bacterium]
ALMRYLIAGMLTFISTITFCQEIASFGIFGGFNFPFTIDQGLRNDPRFFGKFTFRGTPIGLSYGYDKVGLGFLISPAYMQIGQQFTIVNYLGGNVGTRDIQMNYFSIPVALKLHLNDIAFFRLSVVAALNFSYLLKGQETFTISAVPSARKLSYPVGVSVPNDPNYQITYDGVYVPNLSNSVYVSNDKFSPFQIFAGVGFHSDFDLNDDWSLNFDGRANFGLFDPRSSSYLNELKHPSGPPGVDPNGLPQRDTKPGAPDLYGQRRDIYLSATFGISRIIQIRQKFRGKRTAPKPAGARKTRVRKPRG